MGTDVLALFLVFLAGVLAMTALLLALGIVLSPVLALWARHYRRRYWVRRARWYSQQVEYRSQDLDLAERRQLVRK